VKEAADQQEVVVGRAAEAMVAEGMVLAAAARPA
jgi:hypothetical protein